ncbi:Uncharacterized membrane protein YqaE, homolog of Blt101, UPF0057 family [Zunongwangia mangrovi]|uniref:Uncharacterized membrane protein YqaE, homolog of Blt101, UPF0057 family n=2 Tax=Zunongwangia mangrovi TaxID=1334022 RepID=A0A1I1CZA3_9FLAO|nr:Uncharacterized membrane protein YqaE, homolog of Blt101, UPF0057 family [Zunongwangia mangrovi]
MTIRVPTNVILKIRYESGLEILSLFLVLDNIEIMSIWRVILSIIFPPLAVFDKGCGSILIVLILTLLGWIPGVIAALIILNNPNK